MKYSTNKIIDRFENGENLEYIYFWGHRKGDKINQSCMSQWFEMPFDVNGIRYNTAEHWMMAEKALIFEDHKIHQQILNCSTAKEAKSLGRKVKLFNPDTWEEYRYDVVKRGNFHKFTQNKELAEYLKSTGDKILVETSPYDDIWGIGMSVNDPGIDNLYVWNGLNLLGFALMEVRDILNEYDEFPVLENPILPPWLAYPHYGRGELGFRMGDGQAYMEKLSNYFQSLSKEEDLVYEYTFPAYGEWNGWYNG